VSETVPASPAPGADDGTADGSDDRTHSAIVDLLEGIDAGAILLRPIFDDRDRIIDAEIEWANPQSRSMWFNTEGLAPGTRVRDVYFDADEWLGAANKAWLGSTSRRWIEGHPDATPWTRALEIIRRVGDRLAELTVDRSSDQDLIDAMAAVERQYRAILDDLSLVVISSFAGRGQIEYVNPHAAVLTGLPLDDLRWVATWASLIHPDDLTHVAAIRNAVFANDSWAGPVRMSRPDGEVRHIELRVRGRVADDGHERQFVITMLDVTDRVLAQERAQQTAQLMSLARTSGAFAHEFNNLLQIIAGNLESIPADDDGYITAARSATARAASLVAGLLAFASGRPGDGGLVDIAEMCGRVHEQLSAVIPDGITLRISIPDDLPLARIDEAALFQVMSHLVTNAVEAMTDGGDLGIDVVERPQARCHMNHPADGDTWVAIDVSDTGRGISADDLPHVWEPFHSTKKGAAARGAGLGLSTVHGLVHQFDGHVAIASTPTRGTTVTVSLPGVRPDER